MKDSLPRQVIDMIETYGLSGDLIEQLRFDALGSHFDSTRNHIEGEVVVPSSTDYDNYEDLSARGELEKLGHDALKSGKLALLVLNGGMATRFGGVVKGAVSVDADLSFLGLKLTDGLRHTGQKGPPLVLLMNSHATDKLTTEHLNASHHFGYPQNRIWAFQQCVSVRFRPDGSLYYTDAGEPSYHGTGHGDAVHALGLSGLVPRLKAAGVETVFVTNVDNAVATIDPMIYGYHIQSGKAATIELVENDGGDTGGAPYWLNGHLQLVEHFRLPPTMRRNPPVFNTNTFWLNLDVFESPPPLTWFAVSKEVNQVPVVQFERLLGEVSAFVDSQFLCVPRSGLGSRFIPVKRPEDLTQQRLAIVNAWCRTER
ncbi:MAG: UTP--glucose-1-phosphate uridylyltransferase [Myxococcota bacterium]|nr:UTP--glucose-1-phosphate uridylyltransferase [Myxococcota bacterium]